jgi:hypothetical protein
LAPDDWTGVYVVTLERTQIFGSLNSGVLGKLFGDDKLEKLVARINKDFFWQIDSYYGTMI